MNLYLLPIILLSVICVVFGVFLLLNREKLAKKFAIKAIPSPQKVNKILKGTKLLRISLFILLIFLIVIILGTVVSWIFESPHKISLTISSLLLGSFILLQYSGYLFSCKLFNFESKRLEKGNKKRM